VIKTKNAQDAQIQREKTNRGQRKKAIKSSIKKGKRERRKSPSLPMKVVKVTDSKVYQKRGRTGGSRRTIRSEWTHRAVKGGNSEWETSRGTHKRHVIDVKKKPFQRLGKGVKCTNEDRDHPSRGRISKKKKGLRTIYKNRGNRINRDRTCMLGKRSCIQVRRNTTR